MEHQLLDIAEDLKLVVPEQQYIQLMNAARDMHNLKDENDTQWMLIQGILERERHEKDKLRAQLVIAKRRLERCMSLRRQRTSATS